MTGSDRPQPDERQPAMTDRRTVNVADEVRLLAEYRDERAKQLEQVERRRHLSYQDKVREARARPETDDGPEVRRRDLPAAERYAGEVVRLNADDPAAVRLAARIGGDPSAGFDSDPDNREFDVISDRYIGQTKPANLTYGSQFRNQARETFEACVVTNRTPYFHFESEPHRDVRRKLAEYEERYQVRAIIDVKPLGD